MIHEIEPDQTDENIQIGKFLHEYRYGRQKKELDVENIKIDRMKQQGNTLIVQEIKKTSKFVESARYQLLFYLYQLKKMGILAKGELLFAEERKKESVELTNGEMEKLEKMIKDIYRIAYLPVPPEPKKIKYCRQCAYREYCWAEG